MNKQPIVVVVVSLGSGAAGFFVGYKFAERRLSVLFDERLQKETQGMREFYQAAKKPYATPQEAAAVLIEEQIDEVDLSSPALKVAYDKIIAKEGYKPPQEVVVDMPEQPPAVVQNIFAKNERDPEKPYVISQEEFMQNEREWEQITLTYYQGDNTLTDHREDVIEDQEKTVGEDAILSFGLQSSDPRTVHICNEKLGLMFEVVLHEGFYAKEVLGLEVPVPELPSGRARNDL